MNRLLIENEYRKKHYSSIAALLDAHQSLSQISSVWYGWGFLICVGAGSYYFAKQSIKTDRAQRQAFENERRMNVNRRLAISEAEADRRAAERGSQTVEAPQQGEVGGTSGSGSSQVATGTEKRHAKEESRFEASEPYRSPKGDRLS